MTSYKRFPSLRWIIQEEKAIFSRTGEIIPRKRWFFLSSSLGPGAQLNPSPLKDLASAWEQLFEQSRRRSPLPPSKVRATPNNDIRNDPWHEARWSIARLVPTVTHAYPTTMRPSFQATIQARGQPSASPKRMHNADIRNEQRPPTRISLFVRRMMKDETALLRPRRSRRQVPSTLTGSSVHPVDGNNRLAQCLFDGFSYPHLKIQPQYLYANRKFKKIAVESSKSKSRIATYLVRQTPKNLETNQLRIFRNHPDRDYPRSTH